MRAPQVWDRVRVAPVSTVAEYLHGATGTVESVGRDMFKDEPSYRVVLDEARSPVDHWSGIKSIGLRADQLEELEE